MREHEIEKKVCQYVESYGGAALKLRCEGRNGFPDRTVILPNGKVIFIEFKTQNGRLRSAQQKCIDDLHSLRQEVYVVRSAQDGYDLIDKLIGV